MGKTEPDAPAPPPVEKVIAWKRIYLFVVIFFVVEVALFYLLTRSVS